MSDEDEVVKAMAWAMCIADGMAPEGKELTDYEFIWQIFEGPARRQYRAYLAMRAVLLKHVEAPRASETPSVTSVAQEASPAVLGQTDTDKGH